VVVVSLAPPLPSSLLINPAKRKRLLRTLHVTAEH
jgi:hypothetical protein